MRIPFIVAASSYALVAALPSLAKAENESSLSIEVFVSGYNEGDFKQSLSERDGALSIQLQEMGDGVIKSGHDGKAYSASAYASGSASAGTMKILGNGQFTGAAVSNSTTLLQFSDILFVSGSHSFDAALIYYSIKVEGDIGAAFQATGEVSPSGGSIAYTEWSLNHNVSGGVGNAHLNLYAKEEISDSGVTQRTKQVNFVNGNPYGEHFLVASVSLNKANYIYTGLSGQMRLGNGASGIIPAIASGFYDLGNSVYWGGISQVTALDGAPLDVSIVSASGTDYFKSYIPAVPESSSVQMTVAGLVLILLFSRRRFRSRSTETISKVPEMRAARVPGHPFEPV